MNVEQLYSAAFLCVNTGPSINPLQGMKGIAITQHGERSVYQNPCIYPEPSGVDLIVYFRGRSTGKTSRPLQQRVCKHKQRRLCKVEPQVIRARATDLYKLAGDTRRLGVRVWCGMKECSGFASLLPEDTVALGHSAALVPNPSARTAADSHATHSSTVALGASDSASQTKPQGDSGNSRTKWRRNISHACRYKLTRHNSVLGLKRARRCWHSAAI